MLHKNLIFIFAPDGVNLDHFNQIRKKMCYAYKKIHNSVRLSLLQVTGDGSDRHLISSLIMLNSYLPFFTAVVGSSMIMNEICSSTMSSHWKMCGLVSLKLFPFSGCQVGLQCRFTWWLPFCRLLSRSSIPCFLPYGCT